MNRPNTNAPRSRAGPDDEAALESGPLDELDSGLAEGLDYLIRTLRRRQVGVIERLLQPLELPLGAWYPLIVLGREDGISQRELGKRLGLKDAAIGKAIDNLERAGLLLRTSDETDRRKFLVLLTPKGRKLASQVSALRNDVLGLLHKGFTDKEVALFRSFLQRAHQNLNAAEVTAHSEQAPAPRKRAS